MSWVSVLMLGIPATSPAGELSQLSTGDTAWMLVATALVMIMTPALALFYSGMVREKNVLNTIMLCLAALCLISIQWVLWGYTLSFGPDKGGIIGGLEFLGLREVGFSPLEGHSIPQPAFHDVSGDVCHSHPGSHHRSPHRENEVLLVSDLSLGLVNPGIRPLGPLAMGKWLAVETRGAGFCRRNCGSHQLRGFGSGSLPHPGHQKGPGF